MGNPDARAALPAGAYHCTFTPIEAWTPLLTRLSPPLAHSLPNSP